MNEVETEYYKTLLANSVVLLRRAATDESVEWTFCEPAGRLSLYTATIGGKMHLKIEGTLNIPSDVFKAKLLDNDEYYSSDLSLCQQLETYREPEGEVTLIRATFGWLLFFKYYVICARWIEQHSNEIFYKTIEGKHGIVGTREGHTSVEGAAYVHYKPASGISTAVLVIIRLDEGLSRFMLYNHFSEMIRKRLYEYETIKQNH